MMMALAELLLPCGCAINLTSDTPIVRCAEAQRLLAEQREHFDPYGQRLREMAASGQIS